MLPSFPLCYNSPMSAPVIDKALSQRLLQANELGIRLEVVGGLPIWEANPFLRHQEAIDRIRSSLPPAPQPNIGYDCIHLANVYIVFPDGSLKRPDISIFCREPDEQDEAIALLPEAVIEVISRGYEAKDLESGPVSGYALEHLTARGTFFVRPSVDEVYAGQVVGEHIRDEDLIINVCRTKNLTGHRAKPTAIVEPLSPPRIMTLDEAVEYLHEDELLEVTPESLRIRKMVLDHNMRNREAKRVKYAEG